MIQTDELSPLESKALQAVMKFNEEGYEPDILTVAMACGSSVTDMFAAIGRLHVLGLIEGGETMQ